MKYIKTTPKDIMNPTTAQWTTDLTTRMLEDTPRCRSWMKKWNPDTDTWVKHDCLHEAGHQGDHENLEEYWPNGDIQPQLLLPKQLVLY